MPLGSCTSRLKNPRRVFRRPLACQLAPLCPWELLSAPLSGLACACPSTPNDLLFGHTPCAGPVLVCPHWITPPPHLSKSYSPSLDEASCCCFLEDCFDCSSRKRSSAPLMPFVGCVPHTPALLFIMPVCRRLCGLTVRSLGPPFQILPLDLANVASL